MKTREEIALIKQYYDQMKAAIFAGDAALAELDDPMLRLIAAGKRWLEKHGDCSCEPCIELRDAIDYAEQRRVAE